MPHTLINDLVYEGFGKVVFGTSFAQIVKSSEYMNGGLFIENMNGIGHPFGVFDRINETSLLELIDFSFDSFTLERMDRPLFFVDRYGIGPSVDMMFNNGGIKSGHLRIIPGENIM